MTRVLIFQNLVLNLLLAKLFRSQTEMMLKKKCRHLAQRKPSWLLSNQNIHNLPLQVLRSNLIRKLARRKFLANQLLLKMITILMNQLKKKLQAPQLHLMGIQFKKQIKLRMMMILISTVSLIMAIKQVNPNPNLNLNKSL